MIPGRHAGEEVFGCGVFAYVVAYVPWFGPYEVNGRRHGGIHKVVLRVLCPLIAVSTDEEHYVPLRS